MKIKNDKIIIQITCLIVSIGLWVFVMIQTKPLQEAPITNVAVVIKHLNELESSNMVLMNSDKDHLTVTVKVKGSIDQISKLKNSDFSASIDVLGFPEGVNNAKIDVVGPSGVEIIGTNPSQISCNVEGIISRVMDVTVQYEGKHANNYYMAAPASNPTSVKITGPRSVVNSASAAVATVNVDGAVDDVVKTVPVRVYDGKDTEIFMSSPVENVKVTVPVYPTKYVKLVPEITGNPEEGYQLTDVTVKPDKVRIAARKDILDTVTELKLAELDISGAFNNILAPTQILDTDELIIMDLANIPVVNASIEKIVEKEFVLEASDIQFTNLKEGSEVSLQDPEAEITVVVTGPSSAVNQLNKNDLILTSDLSSAVAGLNNVNMECSTETPADSSISIALLQGSIGIEITESPIEPETTEE
jgi:YbbR domain-containing protein